MPASFDGKLVVAISQGLVRSGGVESGVRRAGRERLLPVSARGRTHFSRRPPSTGRIGASLVVKNRFDGGRRGRTGGRRDVAIAHYRCFDPSSVCFTTLSGTVSPCRSVKTVFRLNPRSSSTTT